MKRITGIGQELLGDGVERTRRRCRQLGYPSATGFIQSHPDSTLTELVEVLNETDADQDPLPTSVHQLMTAWREEATREGEESVERMARRALVNALRSALGDGWPRERSEEATAPLVRALGGWMTDIGSDHAAHAQSVVTALIDRPPPAGWSPTRIDDPNIVGAFERGWKGQMKRALKYVGNFQELGWHDVATAPRLEHWRGKIDRALKPQIVTYLRAGIVFVFSPGVQDDVFESGKTAGRTSYLTDGTYLWPDSLAYFVENYDLGLPEDFIAHAQRARWTIAANIDKESLSLPPES